MRLWHKDLIPVLPRQQLMGQWRECFLIAKNISEKGTPNHILVNRVMEYSPCHFLTYCDKVIAEMRKRKYKIDASRLRKFFNMFSWGDYGNISDDDLFRGWHNDRYFRQCFFNLQEKYDCGGITEREYEALLKALSKKQIGLV